MDNCKDDKLINLKDVEWHLYKFYTGLSGLKKRELFYNSIEIVNSLLPVDPIYFSQGCYCFNCKYGLPQFDRTDIYCDKFKYYLPTTGFCSEGVKIVDE